MAVKGDIAYVIFHASGSDRETTLQTKIFIAKTDLKARKTQYKILAGIGTYCGITFDGACTKPY